VGSHWTVSSYLLIVAFEHAVSDGVAVSVSVGGLPSVTELRSRNGFVVIYPRFVCVHVMVVFLDWLVLDFLSVM